MKAVEMENIEIKFVVLGKYLDTESLDDILNSQSEEEVRNYVPKQLRSPNDAAFLAFSSETTGSPKPVLYSYESIFKNFLYSHIIPGKHVKALYYTTTNSIQANALILMGIISEFTRFIHQKFDVEKTLEVIEANKVESDNTILDFFYNRHLFYRLILFTCFHLKLFNLSNREF